MKHADKHSTSSEMHSVDAEIAEKLQATLPQAPVNPWFVRQVLNLLPERQRAFVGAHWQWIFYGFGGVCLCGAEVMTIVNAVKSSFSIESIVYMCLMSLIMVSCIAILGIPALIRLFREP